MPSSFPIDALESILSSSSQVLSDQSSSAFQERLKRWSNINLQQPRAIVLPKTENDCMQIVRWAISNDIPFVVKAGGMSLYSTIDQKGIIIDLGELSAIKHDTETHMATLIGGITSKAVAVELAKDGCCTALPSSNTVGAIPFFLNGGNSLLVSKIGYASDAVISARIVTAEGKLLSVSEQEHADLFYAIRGAGQYFGLVTSLTVRTFPLIDIFGNKEGSFWSGRFVFPLGRAAEVAKAMEGIVNDSTYNTGGLIMVAAPPPARQPVLAVIARLVHSNSEVLQETVFRDLYELKPLMAGGGPMRIENNADALQPMMAPGDYKKLRLTGIHSYDASMVPKMVDIWTDLTTSSPAATASTFSIQWESQPPISPITESANCMHDIRFWANNLTWCTDADALENVQRHLDEVIAVSRGNQKVDEYVDFANSLREPESPIERRYRGRDRLGELNGLKRKWDPNGTFGQELL